jgi:hypothetical protein
MHHRNIQRRRHNHRHHDSHNHCSTGSCGQVSTKQHAADGGVHVTPHSPEASTPSVNSRRGTKAATFLLPSHDLWYCAVQRSVMAARGSTAAGAHSTQRHVHHTCVLCVATQAAEHDLKAHAGQRYFTGAAPHASHIVAGLFRAVAPLSSSVSLISR